MGLSPASNRPIGKQKRSRGSLLLYLFIVFCGVKFLGTQHFHLYRHAAPSRPPPILAIPDIENKLATPQLFHFTGILVRGNGTNLDLGDRRTHLPASLLSNFFPDPMVLPSCLTQLPPEISATQAATLPLPIRDDWPGFYGAPWVAHVNGSLIAVLHVYAPRDDAKPVTPPEFQIYPGYDGQQTSPGFDTQAPAIFQRGSKAVLYRVFLTGPLICLDLTVQNGENNGIGHLYYVKYHHYFEKDATFQIQP